MQYNKESSRRLYIQRHNRQPSQEETYFFHFFSYAWAYTLLEWLRGDYTLTPEEFATLEYKALPALITDTWAGDAEEEKVDQGQSIPE